MRLAFSLMLCASMVGCASNTPQPTTRDTEAFASKVISDKVAVAANAQREYVALLNEDMAVLTRKQTSLESDEIEVDFIGKPQELLQTFAHRYGYRYVETGRTAELRTINVKTARAKPIDVLRNVGHQIDHGADLVLDKDAKVLRLVYKNDRG